VSVSREEMARRLGIACDDRAAPDGVSRRSFMTLLGASIGLAGLDGCTRMPASNILPYVHQPELTPGVPQYYATSMVVDGFARGVLVETHEGRPTKIEGNPDHPATLGAAGVLEQASVLQLYDPYRARGVRRQRNASTWDELAAALAPARLAPTLGARGGGLFLLLPPTSSTLESDLLARVADLYPAASVHFYAPLAGANDALLPHYDFGAADVIVSVDADFLSGGPFHLRYANQFASRRRPEASHPMNRLYVAESDVTVTGAIADHRLAARPADLLRVLEALRATIAGQAPNADGGAFDRWIRAAGRDLQSHRGRSIVIAGPYAPPRARALAAEINALLDNTGRTVWETASPITGAGNPRQSLAALVDALRTGAVRTLLCAGVNASYATAGALDFPALISKVPQTIYLGLYDDETSRACTWSVASAHYLESWGDARAYDGTLSLIQPVCESITGGKTTSDVLAALAGVPQARAYDLLRDALRRSGLFGGNDFEDGWRAALQRGFVDGTASPREHSTAAVPVPPSAAQAPDRSGIDVIFRPHARVHDGSFANNAWLQELPHPITTLTWDNAAHVSPATAERLGLLTGDIVRIAAGGRDLRIPVTVVNGHADETVSVQLGGGRDGGEGVARGVGVNVYPLWPGDTFSLSGATVSREPDGARRQLAMTQSHHTLGTAHPARVMSIAHIPQPASAPAHPTTFYASPVSLPDGPAPHQWAMSIDLSACIGCGACTIACQAENNIPVVGRDEVLRGREMHWLRIDWYDAGTATEPATIAQPMLCQQCEKAPCEYVCPVEATVHSRDGLNEMIYNRCVGTRFCSNNCPYKVRRFNWYDFNAGMTPTERLGRNPDVTVRERGVMEKCTFCVQRIREAEIAARLEDRPLRGADIRTACQQACPARAITFGSLSERDAAVSRDRANPRAYAVLDDLGTEPRVRYLARVTNPSPGLEGS
jgi:Fe-S-cluster-containing dehydrogenase component